MGNTLTGQIVAETYDALLKVTDNNTITGTKKRITDGFGNDTPLLLSSTDVQIDGNLLLAGTISQYVRGDGSFATFTDVGLTSVGITLGSAGTDAGVSGSPLTANGSITLNLPSASATNRGLLTAADWTTFNSKQGALTLTTTGSSGSSTFVGSTLNIPTYTLAGLGGVPTSRTLTINGTTFDLTANRSWTITDTGLTSVGVSMPSAFTVSNSPLTANGTIAITGAGNALQYIDGTGALQTFPTFLSADKLITEVYNSTGATLTKGTIVYINGTQGNLPTVAKALAVGDTTSAQTFGFVQTDITNMNNGYVIVAGKLTDLDTSAYTGGTQLYLSPTTAGTYTSTKQYAPNHLVYVGIVVRAHPTQGSIEVKIQNGYELDELHDVIAQTPSNNDGIFYNSTSTKWENKSIATALGFTPVTNARTISTTAPLSGGGDLSANRTLSILQATTSTDGYLSSTNWNTFNNKENVLTFSSPLSRSTNTISIPVATSSVNGYLSSTDWTTFNSKVPSTRTLTINGTAYDLSADRSWTIAAGLSGSGTTNYVAKFTGTSSIGNSLIYDNGTNVGIGIAAPFGRFHSLSTGTGSNTISGVFSDGSTNGNAITISNSTGLSTISATYLSTAIDSNLAFQTTTGGIQSERMRITAAGNVGIGTTSPARKLVVSNGGSQGIEIGASTITDIIAYNRSTSSYLQLGFEASSYSFGVGNVGIGTSSPSQKLDVQGSVLLNSSIGPNTGYQYAGNNDWVLGENAGEGTRNFNLYNYNTGSINFSVNRGSGNVGIGTTSPGQRLEVNGNAYATGDMRAPVFYDSNNTGYYVDPASTSNLNALNVVSGNVMMRRLNTLDMSGLDNNTWYPVTIAISAAETYRFRIENGLNSNVPSWSTHPGGFSILLEWTTNGSGWGVNAILRNIQKYTQSFASVTICAGVTQMNQSSNEVVYLRGGGIYYFYSDRYVEPIIRTSSYTVNGQTVAPTGSIVNDIWSSISGSLGAYNLISYDVTARSRVDSPIYYDIDNTGYYLNPAGNSSLYYASFANDLQMNGNYLRFDQSGTRSWNQRATGGNLVLNSGDNGGNFIVNLNLQAPVFYDSNNTSYYFDGSSTGDSIRVAGDVVAYYSDERLKDKKGNIENALEKILSLDGFYYEANELAQSLGYEKKPEVGLSAQQVEAILPEIIKEAPISKEYKTFNYGRLMPLVVEAMKEQQTIINNQQLQIEELKQLVNKLINK